jgi:hypothetical protein
MESSESASGPLFDDDTEVVQALDNGFDIAAEFGAVFSVGQGRLCHSDDATIAPGTGR